MVFCVKVNDGTGAVYWVGGVADMGYLSAIVRE
jgi:hypothetical protein